MNRLVEELDTIVAQNGTRQLVRMDEDRLKAWRRPIVLYSHYMDDDERWLVTRVDLHLEQDEGTPIEYVEAAEAIFRNAERANAHCY